MTTSNRDHEAWEEGERGMSWQQVTRGKRCAPRLQQAYARSRVGWAACSVEQKNSIRLNFCAIPPEGPQALN